MTKRRLACVAISCCLAGTVVCAFVLGRARDSITEANYRRLADGMTRDQVEQILGGPAGDYSGGTADPTAPITIHDGERSYSFLNDDWGYWSRGEVWIGHEAAIRVTFDVDGKVCGSGYRFIGSIRISPLRRLLRWFGL
jgi:hypothetical protein